MATSIRCKQDAHPVSRGIAPSSNLSSARHAIVVAARRQTVQHVSVNQGTGQQVLGTRSLDIHSLAYGTPSHPPQHPFPQHPASELPGHAQLRLASRDTALPIAASRYLMSAIMSSGSWQQLDELMEQHDAVMNHVHVSALLTRLPKLVPTGAGLARALGSEKARFSRMLGAISEVVMLRLDAFDPRGLANTMWAVSKLGFSPSPPLLNKLLFEAYVKMDQFKPQELANIAWALATMEHRPVAVWLCRFMECAAPHAAALRPQEVANLLWALNRLQHSGPLAGHTAGVGTQQKQHTGEREQKERDHARLLQALVAQLVEAAGSQLIAFRPGELLMALVALRKLSRNACQQLLEPSMHLLLRRHIHALTPQDLACMWELMCACHSPRPVGRLTQEELRQGLLPRPAPQLTDALLAASTASMPQHSAREMSITLWALGGLLLRPPLPFLEALCQRYEALLPAGASYASVLLAVWGLARLRCRPPASFMAALLASARVQLAAAHKPFHVVALMWGLQQLQYTPDPQVLEALTATLQRTDLSAFRLTNLTTVLAAYTAMRCVPPETLLRACLERSLQCTRGAGAANAIAFTCRIAGHGVGTLSCEAGKFSDQWKRVAIGVLRPVSEHVPDAASSDAPVAAADATQVLVRRVYRPPSDLQMQWLASLEQEVLQGLPKLSPGAISALLNSLARLRIRPSTPTLELLVQHATESDGMASLPAWQIGEILTALARLRYRPPQPWLQRMLAALEPQLRTLTHTQLVNVAGALAALRFRPEPGWLLRFVRACMSRLSRWQPSLTHTFLRALSELRVHMRGDVCTELREVVADITKACRARARRAGKAALRSSRSLRLAKGRNGHAARAAGASKERDSAAAVAVMERVVRDSRLPQLPFLLCDVCSELEGCAVCE